MLLEELPSELLTLCIQRLNSTDRFTLRKSSRKFHALADAEGVLPLNPRTIWIDYPQQTLLVSCSKDVRTTNYERYYVLINGTLRSSEEFRIETNYEDNPFGAFCDVGEDWSKYAEQYAKKLNHFHHAKIDKVTLPCRLIVMLSSSLPDRLLQLDVTFHHVVVHTETSEYPHKHRYEHRYDPLPVQLDSWLFRVTSSEAKELMVKYALSVEQIDRFSFPRNLFCSATDETAMYLLNKFCDQTLPVIDYWALEVEPNSEQLFHALEERFGLQRAMITILKKREFERRYCGDYCLNISPGIIGGTHMSFSRLDRLQ